MDKEYFIYLTTNLINQKKYIGKHYGYINDNYLGSGTLIRKAIEKYGRKNFQRTVLDFSISEEENCEKEKYYINLFKACEREDFYNIHEGGNGVNAIKGYSEEQLAAYKKKCSLRASGEKNPMYGIKRPQEYKDKMSFYGKYIRNNNIYRTKEYREKMSKLTSGKKNGMYGKHHSEETKKIISEKHIGQCLGEKNGMFGKTGDNAINGKWVQMLDKETMEVIKTFHSKLSVLSFLGIKGHVALDKAIKNGTEYKGYYWKQIDKNKSVETN